ncbi:MFS transporter [Antarcticibacterium sp. 1MA-6-2]|uniref:MFS transporter n=1 Tax=Antarcticibacterium sp. 1MA-6-2 TaxID=2908210 RepID=UPI001F381A08|nr:MFS transporter [Antarcticibacterium sp. 1MA-6-2]UJH93055.1 MFS transporter [Antarcticibacterium sp. 1MA-6-2]
MSGWLVSRFDSRQPLLISFLFFSIALVFIGFAENLLMMVLSIGMFSFSMRILNISMNTQSLTLQKFYEKRIIGSFHGLWSAGGLFGVGCSTLMIHYNVSMETHLAIIGGFFLLAAGIAYQNLLKKDRAKSGNKLQLKNPDKFILYLGIMIFFAAVCEGGMFDWSGVFFKEVVKEDTFTLGYFIFMLFMAISRFFSDRLIDSLGMQNMFILSASIISMGILLMVFFPVFWLKQL